MPAGTFFLSLVVVSPGLCSTRLMSHSSGWGDWAGAGAATARIMKDEVKTRRISTLPFKCDMPRHRAAVLLLYLKHFRDVNVRFVN